MWYYDKISGELVQNRIANCEEVGSYNNKDGSLTVKPFIKGVYIYTPDRIKPKDEEPPPVIISRTIERDVFEIVCTPREELQSTLIKIQERYVFEINKTIRITIYNPETLTPINIEIRVVNHQLGKGLDYLWFLPDLRFYRKKGIGEEYNHPTDSRNRGHLRRRLGIQYRPEFGKWITYISRHFLINGIYDEDPFLDVPVGENIKFNERWIKYSDSIIYREEKYKSDMVSVITDDEERIINVPSMKFFHWIGLGRTMLERNLFKENHPEKERKGLLGRMFGKRKTATA